MLSCLVDHPKGEKKDVLRVTHCVWVVEIYEDET